MILYGGRISLFIGLISTVLSTTIAVIYGSFSGIAPEWIDELMMRFTEILLSIPSILLIIFLQALAGKNSVVAITIVIGFTSWMNIAKMVRTEVRQLRESEYLIAAKCMGGSFWHILRDYVYGRDEHQKCNHSRVNIELSWDWSSDGNHFLGEHALAF